MRLRKWWMAAAALVVIGGVSLAAHAHAQTTTPATEPDYPRGRVSGTIFADYYYNVTGDPQHRYGPTGSDSAKTYIDNTTASNGTPTQIGRDLNGTQIRRVYLQLDNDLSAKYSTRVRLEADSKSLTSDGKLGLAVRNAYLQVKNMLPRTTFLFGVLTTPIWENSEEFYGYRSVEKTISDFRGIGSSADIGAELKGYADDAHRVGFSAMLGNGLGNKPEDNRYKKLYLSVPLRPTDDIRIEPFVDYEWVPSQVGGDKATYKLFAGWEGRKLAAGGELVDRVNHATSGRNKEPFGFSLFGRYKAHEKATVFARYDRWQPNTRAADRIDTDLYIAGVDWEPYKDVHVMPNVETTQYRARGAADAPPHHDMQARVTFYFKFAKP